MINILGKDKDILSLHPAQLYFLLVQYLLFRPVRTNQVDPSVESSFIDVSSWKKPLHRINY